jgi:serine phosphatase RsbU (regulator of sigma subunit)
MPIGMHPKDNVDFTNYEIQLFPGDLIYVFSDGFISQFGGQSGKKFNVKKFHQLLLDIHKETLDVQKQKLENAFYSWQAHYEQIDDILVIGIKVNDRN